MNKKKDWQVVHLVHDMMLFAILGLVLNTNKSFFYYATDNFVPEANMTCKITTVFILTLEVLTA